MPIKQKENGGNNIIFLVLLIFGEKKTNICMKPVFGAFFSNKTNLILKTCLFFNPSCVSALFISPQSEQFDVVGSSEMYEASLKASPE